MAPQGHFSGSRRRSARAAAPHTSRRAFTLIELLTVIAIMAILAAIIFPVFASVRENARRTACMSNMRQIQVALRQYQLDNRAYPEFLFGPAVDKNNVSLGTSMQAAAASPSTAKYTGLYPEYVRSLDVYNCPNNIVSRTPTDTTATATVTVSRLLPTGTSVSLPFYTYDSYDVNPRITGPEAINTSTTGFVTRYSRIWTKVDYPTPADALTDGVLRSHYSRQLYWKNPPDDTYVTMCSYHVPKSKVVVLWLNGTTKVLDVRKLDQVKSGADYEMFKYGPAGPVP